MTKGPGGGQFQICVCGRRRVCRVPDQIPIQKKRKVARAGIGLAALALLSLPALADPPFITDDPEPTEHKQYEIRLFTLGPSASGELTAVAPSCDRNYGGFPNVQLHIQPGAAIAKPNGSSFQWGLADTELGIKYHFIGQDKASLVPSIAIQNWRCRRAIPRAGLARAGLMPSCPCGSRRTLVTGHLRGRRLLDRSRARQQELLVHGSILERKITDHFMLGIELFQQTANVASTGSPGFGGQRPNSDCRPAAPFS